MKNRITEEIENKNFSKVSLVVAMSNKSDITISAQNTINRLNNKAGALVIARNENNSLLPLKLNDLDELEDINYPNQTTLCLIGHASIREIAGKDPESLQLSLVDFLEKSQIKHVKIAGCHSGSRITAEFLDEHVSEIESIFQEYFDNNQDLVDNAINN